MLVVPVVYLLPLSAEQAAVLTGLVVVVHDVVLQPSKRKSDREDEQAND